MIRQEAILRSPLRVLDRAIRGGLGKGRLGVLLAAAGVGKSACLVQIGLDALLRKRAVLHLAIGRSVEHVAARYEAQFDELARGVALADRGGVGEAMVRRRLIWSCAEGGLGVRALDEALVAFQPQLALGATTILLDGLDWQAPEAGVVAGELKARAALAAAEVWATARDGRGLGRDGRVAALPDGGRGLVDVLLLLEPRERHARLRLLKDLDALPGTEIPLVLEGGALRALAPDDAGAADARCPEDFTLLATGAAGAEAEFGANAERWGVAEVNYTSAGRRDLARTRGRVELGEDELKLGEVSAAWLKAHLHGGALDAPELRQLLQVVWHQVSGAGEVFCVGAIGPEAAPGGAGWAVELARHWGKPVHLFDEGRRRWVRWDGAGWVAVEPPVITHARFAAAGTGAPSDEGRAAIRALFERSFGPPA